MQQHRACCHWGRASRAASVSKSPHVQAPGPVKSQGSWRRRCATVHLLYLLYTHEGITCFTEGSSLRRNICMVSHRSSYHASDPLSL